MRQRKRRMAYITWTSVAAVVVFAFIAGWMLNKESGTISETFVEEKVLLPESKGKNVQPETKIETPENEQRNVELASIDDSGVPKITSETGNTTRKDESAKEKEDETPTQELATERINYKLLATATVVFDKVRAELAKSKTNAVQKQNSLSDNDRLFIAGNIRHFDKESSDDKVWIVGAHVSPGYSAHSSSYSSQYEKNMNQVSEGGVSNVGGGVSVQYKSTKRLSVESGVYYAQNSQSEGPSANLFAFSPSFDYSASPQSGNEFSDVYTNSIRVSNEGIAMNSTAGIVNMSSTPKGAEISALTDAKGNEYNALVTNGGFSQEFDLLEIPLYLRYKLIDRKFGVDIIGGLNAGLVVGNNAYIENGNGKQNVGKTEDISTLNLSGTVGFGVNYSLGKHFSLALEPRLNYYLNSINSNPDIDYKPYRVGLFSGVYYEF